MYSDLTYKLSGQIREPWGHKVELETDVVKKGVDEMTVVRLRFKDKPRRRDVISDSFEARLRVEDLPVCR